MQNYYSHQEVKKANILIFIMSPVFPIFKIKVLPSDPINVIFSFLPAGNKIIFHGGKIIESDNSFNNNGIKNYDRIAIINKNQMTFQIEQFWKQITQNEVDQALGNYNLYDPGIVKEILPQQDLFMLRSEDHPRFFLNLLKYFKVLTDQYLVHEFPTVLNWKITEKPNEKTLPKIW
jgi:hypothetical protein